MDATFVREIDSDREFYGRSLGQFLRKRREELCLSQEDVAMCADIDKRHYQDLEHGFSNSRLSTPANPRLSTLVNLAASLEMDVDDFMTSLGRLIREVQTA